MSMTLSLYLKKYLFIYSLTDHVLNTTRGKASGGAWETWNENQSRIYWQEAFIWIGERGAHKQLYKNWQIL